jgi:hypothetical protein
MRSDATLLGLYIHNILVHFRLGLPDGIFSNQKFQFGQILESLAMEDVGIIYGHLVHVVAIWYRL